MCDSQIVAPSVLHMATEIKRQAQLEAIAAVQQAKADHVSERAEVAQALRVRQAAQLSTRSKLGSRAASSTDMSTNSGTCARFRATFSY